MMIVWSLAWRLLRGQAARVFLLVACIALGITARVCVGSFSGALDRALTAEARNLLGADVEIAANQPLTAEEEADLQAVLPASARTIDQVRFTSMALVPGAARARTVEVRAVSDGYPLYDSVVVRGKTLKELFTDDPQIFVQQELLGLLAVAVGDRIRLGQVDFTIAGVIESDPGMGSNPFALGPRILMSKAHLEATGLTGIGSRLRYSRLVALDPAAIETVVTTLRSRWELPDNARNSFGGRVNHPRGLQVRTAVQASDAVERAFERIADFLRIIALAAVLLGGVGVASLVRGFIAESHDTIATLQMIGATPSRVGAIFLLQGALLGLCGGVLGAVMGTILQNGLLIAVQGMLPVAAGIGIDVPAMLWGVMLGVSVATGFAALSVAEIHALSPAAIARGEQGKGGWRVFVVSILLIAAIFVLAAHEAHSWVTGPAIVGSLIAGAFATAGIGWLTLRVPSWFVRQGHGRFTVGIRHGLRNLTRPGYRPLAAIVAIAAAAHLLGTMAIYRASLDDELAGGASRRPGTFCIDLQDDQVADFQQFVREKFAVESLVSPMVLARLQKINDELPGEVQGATREDERKRFFLGREQRLSWRTSLSEDEEIVAGTWMANDGEQIEASLEQRFAKNLGVDVGDTLTFDILGVPITATVTSIRRVRWINLRPNFFVLLSPHALRDAPQTWVAAIPQVPSAKPGAVVGALAHQFPGLTAFDVGEIGSRLQDVIARIAVAVNLLGWFCLAAGVLVLIGIGIGTARSRRQDAALLNVLGATPWILATSIAAEFACLAFLAGVIGAGLGIAHGYIILQWLMELRVLVPWRDLGLLIITIIVVGVGAGLFACRQVFSVRPLVVLRDE